MKKNFLKYISIIKKEYKSSIYPPHIERFDKKIFILKMFGNISIILTVTDRFAMDPSLYNFLIYYSIVYCIYRIILTYYATVEFYKFIKNKEFIVRNSPLDHIGTMFRLFTRAFKDTTTATIGTGSTYILLNELDNVLIKEGKEPYFIPKIKEATQKLGIDKHIANALDHIGIKDKRVITDSDLEKTLEKIKTATEIEKKRFEEEYNIPFELLEKTVDNIINNRQNNLNIIKNLKDKIEKENPFNI
jgi:hypothetical protein